MRQHRAIGTPIELYKALAKDAAFPLPVAISSDSVDTEVVYSYKHAEHWVPFQQKLDCMGIYITTIKNLQC
jgi:hypothetical protein